MLPAKPRVLLLALAAALAGAAAPAQEKAHPSIEAGLLASVPDILKYCREHEARRLGVLKFRVKKEGDITRDRVGPLNYNLARRLEIALILENDRAKPVDILKSASTVVARIRGADHLDRKKGRRLLFFDGDARREVFPLSWGKDPDARVAADAFIAGHVELRADGGPATVRLLGLDRKTLRLVGVAQFRAKPNVSILAETGESFQLRGIGRDDTRDSPFVLAGATKKGEAPLPVKAAPGGGVIPAAPPAGDLPVELVIRYDGVPQPIKVTNNQAEIAEPAEGQKVSFHLTRKDNSTEDRYAVVLMVNGQNTLGMQRSPPDQCLKWVLSKGTRPLVIKNFYTDPQALAAVKVGETGTIPTVPFTVSSPEVSEINAERYGDDCGQITFVVFRETGKAPPRLTPPEKKEQKKIEVVRDGEPPADLPADPDDARQKLLDSVALRGLIEPGPGGPPGGGSAIRKVKLTALEQVSSLTITYYKAGK